MNKLILAGHLGADPEARFLSSGKKVTTLRLATKSRSKDGATLWWRVSIWGDNFDGMLSHLKKGSPVFVSGDMHQPEIYMDKEGKPQISLSMTAVDVSFSPFGKPENSSPRPLNGNSENVYAEVTESAYGQGKQSDSFADDDEIPF